MLKRKTGQNRFLIGDGQNNGNTRQYRNKTICASCIEKTLIVSFVILLFVYDVYTVITLETAALDTPN